MDAKKKAILDSARGLFLGQGFSATTIQAIADAAGVSKGAVYLHFRSKQELFFGLMMAVEEEVWRRVDEVRCGDSEPREKLRRIMSIYFEFIHENRMLSEIQIREVGLAFSEEMLQSAQSLRIRWQDAIDECVVNFVGEDYAEWKGDLGFAVTGLMDSFQTMLLVDRTPVSGDAVTEFILLLVATMPAALSESGLAPMFGQTYLAEREQMIQDLGARKRVALDELLSQIETIVQAQVDSGASYDQVGLLGESLTRLAREARAEDPDKVIVQGMLASLRTVPELAALRSQLAQLLGVKLV